MVSGILVIAIILALFVGFNIGGSGTGPAFGPVVGADVISKPIAAILMSLFFFVGGWMLGRPVVRTLGNDIVGGNDVFTLGTATIVLLFIGVALFIGNFAGVPTSTSMTTVGAIAALGLQTGTLNWSTIGEILSWWLVAPIVAFWISGIIGRYFYTRIDKWVNIKRSNGPLIDIHPSRPIPVPKKGKNTTTRELIGSLLLVGIGCLMAISTGASNIANAISPLYAADVSGFDMERLIIIGSIAVAIGAFTIGRRTMNTVGNDITQLPLTAAIIVAVISSILVVGLAAIGIPASFVIIATMSIVGLGWGRATRTATIAEGIRGEKAPNISVGALASDTESPTIGNDRTANEDSEVASDKQKSPEDIPTTSDLFDPATTARVVIMQNVVPVISTVGAYGSFWILNTHFGW